MRLLYVWSFCLLIAGCDLFYPGSSGNPTDEISSVLLVESLRPDAYPSDPYQADVVGPDSLGTLPTDTLTLRVSYSGGCANHHFRLYGSSAFMESYPVQTHLLLTHEDEGDPCDAIVTDTLRFSLAPLRETYQRGYQSEHGIIIAHLLLSGQDAVSLRYTF